MSRSLSLLILVGQILIAAAAHARNEIHPAMVDIHRDLVPLAETIVRGRVTDVSPSPKEKGRFIAHIQTDRWYRGAVKEFVTLSFSYNRRLIPGHDCILFQPQTYWILFAKVDGQGQLTLVDDCYGALPVSSKLAADAADTDAFSQMEADFEAGLSDADPKLKLESIWRLGNLHSPKARLILHQLLENKVAGEEPWLVLAALRTGDTTVLPEAAKVLQSATWKPGWTPEMMIALQIREIHDPSAVPGLLQILDSTHNPTVSSSVITALGENLQESRALDRIASFLGSADKSLAYSALVGVWKITHSKACEPTKSENELPLLIERCRSWWNTQNPGKTPIH